MTVNTEQSDLETYALIGRLSAGLAHALNGPIGIALGFTELAKETLDATNRGGVDPQTAAKLGEYLQLINSSTRRARELARDVTAFARATPGKTEDFNLSELVGHAAALSGPAVKEKSLEIISKGESEEVFVTGDRALTLRSLVRLMLSSMETLPQGGTVYWEVRSVDGDDAGSGEFTLTAEPWGEVSSNEWPVDDQVRSAFESQGGSLNPVTGVSMKSGGSSALAWIVSGRLPAASGEASQAS